MSPTLRNKNISRNTKSLVINAFVNSTLYYGMQCHTLTATQLKELNSVVMDAKRVAINMRRNDHIRNEEIDLKVQTYNVSATILGQRTRMANMIEMYAKTSWKILNTEPEGGGNRNQWVKSKWFFSKSTGGAVNDTATKFSCAFCEAEFSLRISLKKHTLRFHREPESRDPGLKWCTEEFCYASYKNGSGLDKHMAECHRKNVAALFMVPDTPEQEVQTAHLTLLHEVQTAQMTLRHEAQTATPEQESETAPETPMHEVETAFNTPEHEAQTALSFPSQALIIPKDLQSYTCQICSKKVNTYKAMVNHGNSIHRISFVTGKPTRVRIAKN